MNRRATPDVQVAPKISRATSEAGGSVPQFVRLARSVTADSLAPLLERLLPDLSFTGSETHPVERILLDTQEWLLDNAGIKLVHEVQGRTTRLALTSTIGGSIHVARGSTSTDFSKAGCLHSSELAPRGISVRVERAAEGRALIEKARYRADITTIGIRDRITDRHIGTVELTTRLSSDETWLTIATARDATSLARSIARALSKEYPTTVSYSSTSDEWESVLTAMGRKRRDYSASFKARYRGDATAAESVGLILSSLLVQLQENLPGLVGDYDVEFCHETRIALRRARTILKFTTELLPSPDVAEALSEGLRTFATLCGHQRDLDVLIQFFARDVPSGERSNAALGTLRSERANRHGELRDFLKSSEMDDLVVLWKRCIASYMKEAHTHLSPSTATEFHEILERHGKRIRKLADSLAPAYPVTGVHTLRKRVKELRYLLEFSQPIIDPTALASVISFLKEFQDLVGSFNDLQVGRALLSSYVPSLPVDDTKGLERFSLEAESKVFIRCIVSISSLASGDIATMLWPKHAAPKAASGGKQR